MRKSRIRIRGNDRAYMMLVRDIRKRWLQYGENRKGLPEKCFWCKLRKGIQIDHIEPLGTRPRIPADFCTYIDNMFTRKCQVLCKSCHRRKTNAETKKRKLSTKNFSI